MKIFSPLTWLALLALAACAQQPRWDKPDSNEAALKNDTDSCYQQARVSPATRPAPPPSAYGASSAFAIEDVRVQHERDVYERCMEKRGYSSKR